MPAVVLGGSASALSVARSLGSTGVPVTILADGITDCLARRSRFCHRYVHYTASQASEIKGRWLEWLMQNEPAVVLACCDEGVELIARHRPELAGVGHLPVEADDDVLLAMLDKQRTYELAAGIGVGTPRMVTAHSHDEADRALGSGLSYPCAVKPTRSDALLREVPDYATPKGTVVRHEAELRSALATMFAAGVGALITEIVPGDDSRFCSYYTYLDERGSPLLHFTKTKPRQYPIAFGGGTFHLTKWQPDVAELGLRLFQSVGLRGLGVVEFKRDERDGGLKLIECNARFSMANAIVARAGIDLAQLAYNRLVGRPLPPVDSFRDNVCLWFFADDVRALRAYRATGELTVSRWLRSLAHVPHFPTFQWSDPGPALAGARGALRARRRRSAARGWTPRRDPVDHSGTWGEHNVVP